MHPPAERTFNGQSMISPSVLTVLITLKVLLRVIIKYLSVFTIRIRIVLQAIPIRFLSGCGVMERFYPHKRIIDSKDHIKNDSILFTNRSVNAADYQWWLSNSDSSTPAHIISAAYTLSQIFSSPGKYSIWLVAANNGCTDTTEKFNFTVSDPTVDAVIGLGDVECFEQTKIKVGFQVCNNGYAPIPAGTPVSFYEGDPATDTAKKLDTVYLLPSAIQGSCCASFERILDVGRTGINSIYAVINDNGSSTYPSNFLTVRFQNQIIRTISPLPKIFSSKQK